MKKSAILALVIGLALAATLLATNDIRAIAAAVAGAGWAILLVIALHLPQTFVSGLAWGALIEDRPAPKTWLLYRLRWVRESVNSLLPVAQIGGDFIRACLAARRGIALKSAAAGSVVDLSAEMVAQIAFTVIAIALLIAGPHADDAVPIAVAAATIGATIMGSFIAAQRFGLFRLIEPIVKRVSADGSWSALGQLSGLHEAVVALYRQPRRFWSSAGFHLISWIFGALETWAALHALGLAADFREAAIVEGLSQIVRSLAFLIPGALGVQEGGYLLIGALFAISPQNALALSLLRRVRELALGLPGLILWHRMETRATSAQEVPA